MDKHTTSQEKGLAGWIEVFRAGSHTDAKGQQISFSQADLDQMVVNHALGAAPAVLGHPKHNDPAYAWTSELKRDGDSLFAKFTDINADFSKGVESGAYRNRSVSVVNQPDTGWRVRHVGWLGAMPPAIDGLRPVEFADGQEHFEFSMAEPWRVRWGFQSIANILRRVRESVIADKGLEAADAVVSSYDLSTIEDAARAVDKLDDATSSFSHQQTNEMTTFTQEDLDRARQEGESTGRQAASAEFSAQVTTATERANKAENETRTARIGSQIDGWVREGKVLPAERPGMAEFMAHLEGGTSQTFEFSAADGTASTKTPAAWFASFMASRTAAVRLGHTPDGGDPGAGTNDSQAIADKAQEFMKAQSDKGITVSIADAVAHVSKGAA